MVDWHEFEAGMAAARTVPDVALQATTTEAKQAAGLDFMARGACDRVVSWHQGFDHAVLLARKSN
jgi:hypothetical protein